MPFASLAIWTMFGACAQASRATPPATPLRIEPGDWREVAEGWRYEWTFPNEVRLEFLARARAETVEFEYTLVNQGKDPLSGVRIFPCLPTMGVPSFHPGTDAEARADSVGRKARVGQKDWSELYERLFLTTR